jgi:hypothetical protein
MKIGEKSQYAYHIANYEVDAYETIVDTTLGTSVKRKVSDSYGNPVKFILPFSLPTRIYDQSYVYNAPQNIALTAERTILADAANTTTTEIAQEYDCNASNIDDTLVNETCTPKSGLPIYLAVADTYYGDNDSELSVQFKSGATTTNDYGNFGDPMAPKTSLFQKFAFFFFKPIFGAQSISKLEAGALVDLSDKDNGIIIQIRNGILQSWFFQLTKTILVVLMVVLYGLNIVRGNLIINMEDFLKRMTSFGVVMWGTDPENYTMIDDLLLPIFFEGITSLGGALLATAANIAGMSIKTGNPFATFDIILSTFYNLAIGYKMLAMFISNPIFWLTFLIIGAFMVIITVAMFWTFIGALVGIATLGITIAVLPIVILFMLVEEQVEILSGKFDAWMSSMEQQIWSTMVYLFSSMIFYYFAIRQFNRIFDFAVCFEQISTVNLLLFSIDFYGWKAQSEFDIIKYLTDLAIFGVVMLLVKHSDAIISKLGEIFGGADRSLIDSGTEMVKGMADSLIEIGTFGGFLDGGQLKTTFKNISEKPVESILTGSSKIGSKMNAGVKRNMSQMKDIPNQTFSSTGINRYFNNQDKQKQRNDAQLPQNATQGPMQNSPLGNPSDLMQNPMQNSPLGNPSDLMQNSPLGNAGDISRIMPNPMQNSPLGNPSDLMQNSPLGNPSDLMQNQGLGSIESSPIGSIGGLQGNASRQQGADNQMAPSIQQQAMQTPVGENVFSNISDFKEPKDQADKGLEKQLASLRERTLAGKDAKDFATLSQTAQQITAELQNLHPSSDAAKMKIDELRQLAKQLDEKAQKVGVDAQLSENAGKLSQAQEDNFRSQLSELDTQIGQAQRVVSSRKTKPSNSQ